VLVDPLVHWSTWLKSDGASSWVQAIGSILAIGASAGIVWWQVNWQHQLQIVSERTRHLRIERDEIHAFTALARYALDLVTVARHRLRLVGDAELYLSHQFPLNDFGLIQVALDGTSHRAMSKPEFALALLTVQDRFKDLVQRIDEARHQNRASFQPFLDEVQNKLLNGTHIMRSNIALLEWRSNELTKQLGDLERLIADAPPDEQDE
jgi:hypothetical protein